MTGAEFRGVDIDLLADYIGGALTGTPDEPVVATLIADDPAWRAAYESLSGGMAAVATELGRFEPEPMPAEVAARLEAALTTPAPRLTLVPDSGDGAPPVREEKTTRRERGRRLRWVTPIAIAAGAVAFVGFGLDYLSGRDGNSADKSASSAAGEAQARRPDSGQAPAIAGAEPKSDSGQDSAQSQSATPQLLSSGTDYTRATLAQAPTQALSAPAPLATASKFGRLSSTDTLRQCLDMIALANGAGPITAESVDYARFEGKPAIVVRFTADNGAWAWASGPSCGTSSGGADTLAKVPVR
ncbi:hypothetical protein [Paractinoplanes globisporus]|uniref:Anti-sigma factor n=1 Tax=Paractinoplanes globisporus TaxID=113565 RepID=A0ABW6WR74_9ACTN|nr:hypothetical protein [Actinoplanes globisporus]